MKQCPVHSTISISNWASFYIPRASLGIDLHTLSHQLHSSTLESLGLVPAVGALCKEFTAQQCIKVDFTSDEIPRSLHSDTALCVFRIVQEGLRNLKKHSGAVEALVDLSHRGNRLVVTVRDEGCGFDLKDPHRDKGIGIRSMEERARSLGGEFQIHSKPRKGDNASGLGAASDLDQELVNG